jgi:MIP family channel proteins
MRPRLGLLLMATRDSMVSKMVAEFVGTFALVFAGCGAIMVAERIPGSISGASIPVVFGLTVASMIYAVGHISGAHFNPAVTIAFAVARHFPVRQIAGYWAAQCLGALAATGLSFVLLPDGSVYGAAVPHVGTLQALGWEIVLTFFLMFVIIAVATDTRAVGTMAGAAIGSTVTLAAYVGGPLTGAAMNPARALAPALAEGQTVSLWIYLVGPIVGAVAAAKLYEWIRCHSQDAQDNSSKSGAAGGCC